MQPNSSFYRLFRSLGFAASLLALLAIVPASGCKRKYPTPGPVDKDPERIKELVKQLAKKKQVGFIKDLRIPSADALAEIGPDAAEFGAIPALEKMAADKDPIAKEAAQKALAKIKGAP
ncbi:MAG TPA: hypothetical protein VGG64_06930 [Pirellulales bacterium]|jgi:hypothetical protein